MRWRTVVRIKSERTSDMSSTTDSGSLNDVIHFKFRSPLALKLTAYLGNSLSTGSLHVRIYYSWLQTPSTRGPSSYRL